MIDRDFCDRLELGASRALENVTTEQDRLARQEQFWLGYKACIGEFRKQLSEDDDRLCGCGARGDHDETHED